MTLPIIHSDLFTFADNCFTVEHSTLVGNYPAAGRTHTIGIKSKKTGKVAPFNFERQLVSEDEVVGWVFGYSGNDPKLYNLTIVVFND